MATPRKPTIPTTDAIDAFCAQVDDLFTRRAARQAFRHYLIGLLRPREHTKTMKVLAALVSGGNRQQLPHFLHDASWDADALNPRRLALWRTHPTLHLHGRGVLITVASVMPTVGTQGTTSSPTQTTEGSVHQCRVSSSGYMRVRVIFFLTRVVLGYAELAASCAYGCHRHLGT